MKKNSKSRKKGAGTPRVDPFLEGLMSKLLDRLAGLERKMDMVIARSGSQPSQGQNPQPKEFPKKDRIMFEAVCADCSKVCEVPFKPVEGRSVYCKPCYAKRKSGGPGGMSSAPRPVVTYKPAPAPVSEAPKPAKPARKSPPAKKKPKKKK